MKNFFTLWFGETVSTIGSGMTAFSVAIYIYQQTHSALFVSLAALFAFLPTILLSPFAAVLSDRFDRRLLMLLGDLLSVIGVVIVLISVLGKSTSVIPVLIGVGISAIFISPVEPAYKASVSDLLTPDEYSRASGMVQIASSSRFLISPVLAGILIVRVGIEWVLMIDILTFFVTAITVTLVRKNTVNSDVHSEIRNTRFRDDFREGLHAVSKDRTVRKLIILMAFMCFFVGFIQVLTTPMVLSFTGEKELGMIQSLCATGMLVSAILIGIIKIDKHLMTVLRGGLLLAAVTMALIGVRANVVWMILFGFLFFFCLPLINTASEVLIRGRIPNILQARAWGLIGLITQLGYIGAYMVSGPGADYVFEPLMRQNGALSPLLGRIFGVGPGRGIAVMIFVAGIGMAFTGWILSKGLKKTSFALTEGETNVRFTHQKRPQAQ